MLWSCGVDGGYWVAVDQQAPLTRFHLFDRGDLSPAGSFSGNTVAQTDGIALHPFSSERFPYGVLYVVNADAGIAAFDWRDIADALNLWLDCPE